MDIRSTRPPKKKKKTTIDNMMAAPVLPPLPLPTITRCSEPQIDWDCTTSARCKFGRRFSNAFLMNDWRSDMSFKMSQDGRTFPAHSLIVGCASPVLERCCFAFGTGDLIDAIEVTVPEYCSGDVFLIILRYLYTGSTNDQLDDSNVATVLKLADYFELCELLDECVTYIEEELSIDNVCSIFNTLYNVDFELNDMCMIFMQNNIHALLRNGTLLDMEDKPLFQLLEQDEMNLSSETYLVMPMIEWADAECVAQSLEVNVANRRKVLESRLHLIRFGCMELVDFFSNVKLFGRDFFTHKELAQTGQQIFDRVELSRQKESQIYSYRKTPKPVPETISMPLSSPPSTDPLPFSSVARVPVHNPIKYETPLDTVYSPVKSNEFILNVSHLKQPFRLLELKLDKINSKVKVLNVLTDETVPHKNICLVGSTTIMFGVGVSPNKNGRIHLRLSLASGNKFDVTSLRAVDTQYAKWPICEHSLTCVKSMTYKHPVDF